MTVAFGSGLIAATGALAIAVWYAFAVYLTPEDPLDASETLVVVLICGAFVLLSRKAWSSTFGRSAVSHKARTPKRGRRRAKD